MPRTKRDGHAYRARQNDIGMTEQQSRRLKNVERHRTDRKTERNTDKITAQDTGTETKLQKLKLST
jgi:hypothetical protein